MDEESALVKYLLAAIGGMAVACGVMWRYIDRQTKLREELLQQLMKMQRLAISSLRKDAKKEDGDDGV